MERWIYEDEHGAFRSMVGGWLDDRVVPVYDEFESAGLVSREMWREAGSQGLLLMDAPAEYGGGGAGDWRFNAVVNEEMSARGLTGFCLILQSDLIAPYFVSLATEEQKQRWLPGMASGELLAAIAMTEPGTGSDLAGVSTSARPAPGGDGWIVNGSKTFISNGILADIVIAVVRTDPDDHHGGLSLLVVERGMEGFERGRNLDKIGMHAQDTAELHFRDVHVPAGNLLGEVGRGFAYLMQNLAQERLTIAITAVARARSIFEQTLGYTKERTAFGKPIGSFQANRFTLAEMATQLDVAQTYVDRCVELHIRGKLTAAEAAAAKWWTTDLECAVIDRCLQLHGGYGYMEEYAVARAFRDSRVQRIYGGTNEIMKEIVGRSLGV